MYNESRSEDKIMKISELIERIKQWHEPYVAKDEGRDLILGGNPDQECIFSHISSPHTLP